MYNNTWASYVQEPIYLRIQERKVTKMKKYMLIWIDEDGETNVHFFDLFQNMENARMDIECSLGLYAEMYARNHIYGDENAPMAYLPI